MGKKDLKSETLIWGYRILDQAQRLSRNPLFTPFHQGLRALYIGPFVSALETYLRTVVPSPELKLRARHSAFSGTDFNAFSSDLDLAVIVPPTTPLEGVKAISEEISTFSHWLPFLGEVEIYSLNQWKKKEELEKKYSSYLTFIRNVRKIHWMQESAKQSADPYHLHKAHFARKKAIEKIWTSLKRKPHLEDFPNKLNEVISEHLTQIQLCPDDAGTPIDDPPSHFCRYLHIHLDDPDFIADPPSAYIRIPIDRINRRLLLATLPTSLFPKTNFEKQFDALREKPQVKQVFLDVLLWETLSYQSSHWNSFLKGQFSDSHQNLLKSLRNRLRESSPKDSDLLSEFDFLKQLKP